MRYSKIMIWNVCGAYAETVDMAKRVGKPWHFACGTILQTRRYGWACTYCPYYDLTCGGVFGAEYWVEEWIHFIDRHWRTVKRNADLCAAIFGWALKLEIGELVERLGNELGLDEEYEEASKIES